MTDRINFNDMPEFVGDIEDILLENNIGDKYGNVVVSDDELEELAKTYNSVGEFLNDLENLYMRTLFDKFEDFLKEQFGEETKINYFLNCRDSWLSMITPKYGEEIEFEDKGSYKEFCKIANTDVITEKPLTNYNNDYPRAIKALQILTTDNKDIDNINENSVHSIFAWLRDSYDENPEIFEPQNAYAEALKARLDYYFSEINETSQSFTAIQKLQNFVLNSLSLEYKTTDDYGVLSNEVREFLEKATEQGKAIVDIHHKITTQIEFLNELDKIDNGEYLDFEIKNTRKLNCPQ